MATGRKAIPKHFAEGKELISHWGFPK